MAAAAVFVGGFCGTSASAINGAHRKSIYAGLLVVPAQAGGAIRPVAACRAHLEIRFADGDFIGLRTQKRDLGLVQREVETVVRCTFNRDKQVDTCENQKY